MIRFVFLVLSVVILPLLGEQILLEYWANHSYYKDMLAGGAKYPLITFGNLLIEIPTNWLLIALGILFALIPLFYIIKKRKQSLVGFVGSILAALYLYGLSYMGVKASVLGSGGIMWLINCTFLLGMLLYFFVGILAFGSFVKKLLFKLQEKNIYDYFISFGLGLSVFLIINYVLVLLNLFFPIVSWIIFLSLGFIIYREKENVQKFESELMSIFRKYFTSENKEKLVKYIGIALLVISIIYLFFGFIYSYIPYPTAWDANHSYFFYPKMWAYNNGFYWNEQWMWNQPYLWVVYIAYWFNLFVPFENLWISPDTIAVVMNFLSGILVLIFSLSLIRKVIDIVSTYFDDGADDNIKTSIFNLGWFLVLLWLTSGMGAFLVFVDNKTDLGVMSLIILAIYSAFEFIEKYMRLEKNPSEGKVLERSLIQSIIISGFMFAAAIMAKPTAFLDVANIGMLMVFLWIGVISIIGLFFIILGILAYIKFRGINQYFNASTGFLSMLFGGALMFAGFFEKFIGNKLSKSTDSIRQTLRAKMKTLYYFLIWGLVIFLTLLVFKGPYMFIIKSKQNILSPQEFFRSIILSKTSSTTLGDLFSTKVYAEEMTGAVILDSENSSGTSMIQQDVNTCNLESVGVVNPQDLFKNLKEPPGDAYNEDVGRYVGYGRKKFENPWWNMFFANENKCITSKLDAKILCEHEYAIENFDLPKLKEVLNQLPQDSDGFKILSGVVNSQQLKDINPDTFKADESIISALSDPIQKLRDYHKDFTIKVRKVCLVSSENKDAKDNLGSQCDVYETDSVVGTNVIYQYDVYVPYKYLIPFNITFNWSLQNLSSYYTDIGFVWLIVLIFICVSLVYALVSMNKFLIGLSGVTIFGWIIWMFIGGGILWYGIGLIIWSILNFIVFVYYLIDKKRPLNKNYLWGSFVMIFIIFASRQLLLNLLRISTQGGVGPFIWYKQSVGQQTIIDDELKSQDSIKIGYSQKDVFNLQFPHYNKFIDLANSRKDGEGIFLAGTYARYFIKKQDGIVYDQFLMWLWKQFSDNDVCKSYLRLKEEKIKYIVIDPNIGTVVMGGGNMSLFDRFFAKINSSTNKLEEDGVITMLAKLTSKGYLKYVSSNNIGAKFAYSLSDEYLKSKVGDNNLSADDMAILRGRLAAARYWSNESVNKLLLSITVDRVLNGDFIGDIADMLGKSADEYKLKKLASEMINAKDQVSYNTILAATKDMSQDEKLVFTQYILILQSMGSDKKSFEENINSFIKQSISASSQIIFLEVK